MPDDPYRSELADGMRIEWNVPIPVDDDTVLRADIFRPDDTGTHPVLMTYGPYGKGLHFAEGFPAQWDKLAADHPDVTEGSTNKYQAWEVVDPERWVPYGYVCIRVDSRGSGWTPGYLDPFSPRETQDYYEAIEWAAAQPWSNGRIGLNGVSYYAMNQWQVAAKRPPHLAAICPFEGAVDFYRDATHHGGIVSEFWATWYPFQVMNVQYGLGEKGRVNPNTGQSIAGAETLDEDTRAANRADIRADIQAHSLDDDFYAQRRPDLSAIEVPVLSAANWGGQGLHSRGNFTGFTDAGSARKWLEVHGLEHWTEFYTDYGRDLQKRFFDHFLLGADNGWDVQPPVQLRIRDTGGGFTTRAEQEWPLARTDWTTYYLDFTDGTLTTQPPTDASVVEFDALGDGVTLLAKPFAEDTEITGPSATSLSLRSSTTDADLFVVLRLFDPDGQEVLFTAAVEPRAPLSQGWLRASHRKLDPARSRPYQPWHTHDELQPLTPGEACRADVEIWPTCVVAPAGYRLGLTVLGRDYDNSLGAPHPMIYRRAMTGSGCWWHTDPTDRPADVFGGRTTLETSPDHPATLLVPIIPRSHP
ncbi:CocE/NonD family hydrolase [Streptomyces sp. NPDC005573]|uniref:CocE/NonD family hydrolase n=1 Tax=Streptomyces sp. NPDC005573 TaxID=3156890 RepID=UPI00339DC1C5